MTNNNEFEKREDSEAMDGNDRRPTSMSPSEKELMPLGRAEIQDLIDELYDYGVDVDENGNPDILMHTVTELTRIRHLISRPRPAADVDYSDYIKRTPIHITMAEMMIDSLKGGLGNQVYIDALEDHIKALTTPRIEDTNVSEALESVDKIQTYAEIYDDENNETLNHFCKTIRQALQSTKTTENVRCENLKNIKDAYEGLIIYNLWRRGSDVVEGQPDPKTLGIWIETAINVMSQALQQIEGDNVCKNMASCNEGGRDE